MTTIITRKVKGYGPYAYRVHGVDHPKAGPNGKYFEYIDPVGKVDPTDLTDEETAQLREEGFALAKYRDGSEAEFAHLDVANSIRDEITERWGDDVISVTDDRRETTIQLAEDAPRGAERLATSNAQADRAEAESGSGQAPLTDRERKNIDFTETDVPTARTHKAAIQDEGVKEWMDVWSEDITTVGEARGAAERNRSSINGENLDNHEDAVAGGSANTRLDEGYDRMEKRAVEGAQEGYDEAIDELRRMGWTDSEINEVTA